MTPANDQESASSSPRDADKTGMVCESSFPLRAHLWIDTANFSGVRLQEFHVNELGEIENESILICGLSKWRRATIDDKLRGDYWNATWHRTKDDALQAQRARIAAKRAEMDAAERRLNEASG